jgi:hypothetical protein
MGEKRAMIETTMIIARPTSISKTSVTPGPALREMIFAPQIS